MVFNRFYSELEQNNIKFLVNHNIKFTQVQSTDTGLRKSILDATRFMRDYFLENDIHDYSAQMQGKENKLFFKTCILTENGCYETSTSFYRPNTKKGDPRLWIYDLKNFSSANDIHVIFLYESVLYTVNITQINIEQCYQNPSNNPIKTIIQNIYFANSNSAKELLAKFHALSGQWIQAEVNADTGVGRTIESLIGINMNSDKTPDFKGIEIKSIRGKRITNRSVLFTQSPNWELSRFKSGREIVDKFGYINPAGYHTYQSTVKNLPNAQNLYLNVNNNLELLELKSILKGYEDVAVWQLLTLHQRLEVKHKETFWVTVDSILGNGNEYFMIKEIEHTYNPNIGQFDILLAQGLISLDMSLSRPSGHGDTYAFKINKQGRNLLFPESKIYKISP